MPNAEQMYDEAIELKEAGKLEEAVSKLEELVGQQPDYALAHAGLSVFYDCQSIVQGVFFHEHEFRKVKAT